MLAPKWYTVALSNSLERFTQLITDNVQDALRQWSHE